MSLSSAQKLAQLFIIHRTYHAPYNLHKWQRRDTKLCPRCEVDTGTFLHMLWKCPKFIRYWTEVISSNIRMWNLSLNLDPKLCLMGWLDEELYTPHTYISIFRVPFIARKLMARKWLSTLPRTHNKWFNLINEVLLGRK